MITIGGIGTILVVMLVVLVLLGNVLPLFHRNSATFFTSVPLAKVEQPADGKTYEWFVANNRLLKPLSLGALKCGDPALPSTPA